MGLTFDRAKLASTLKGAKDREESSGYVQDERFWSPESIDKMEKSSYKIRPLPIITKAGYPEPEVSYSAHEFKSPISGKYIKEKCPKSIGKDCPICELSNKLYNTKEKEKEAISKLIYRKKKWATNILIVKECDNEKRKEKNEGKVFMYVYGMKIHNKFQEALFPPEGSDKEEIFFWDPKIGYDFHLISKKVEGYPNYDSSEFARTPSPIAPTDSKIEDILGSVYDLKEFTDVKSYSTYDTLQEILDTHVLGKTKSEKKETPKDAADEEEDAIPMFGKKEDASQPAAEEKAPAEKSADDDFLSDLEKELGL